MPPQTTFWSPDSRITVDLFVNTTRAIINNFNHHEISPEKTIGTISLIIFCATGNHSIGDNDFLKMKGGCFVFTATSGDDEIKSYQEVIDSSQLVSDNGLRVVENRAGRHIFLCNNGNSVNFLHGGIVGPFIKLVQAELFVALSRLSIVQRQSIGSVSDEDRKLIAEKWIRAFG